jgi:hypothetical protein
MKHAKELCLIFFHISHTKIACVSTYDHGKDKEEEKKLE